MTLTSAPAHAKSHVGRKASDFNAAFRDVPNNRSAIGIPWHLHKLSTELDFIAEGDPGVPGTFVTRSADVVGYVDASAAVGSKFPDETTDAGDTGDGDVLVFPASEAIGDYFLVGDADPILSTQYDYANGTAGVGGVGTWQYCVDGPNDVWADFTEQVDETADFLTGTADDLKFAGALDNAWTPQVLSEVTATLGEVAVPRYYKRLIVTTVYSTNPVLDQVHVHVLQEDAISAGVIAPMTGLIDFIQWMSATASGSANAIIIEILNYTRQTRGQFTIPITTPRGRVELGIKLYVERGDELTFRCIQEDGSTEITDVTLVPEISL